MNLNLLKYWVLEREDVQLAKELGLPKPWSQDPIFQTTYFTNTNREDDKTTKFIRSRINSFSADPGFIWNMALCRYVNRISSLAVIPYYEEFIAGDIVQDLLQISNTGPLWGGAYLVSTNGVSMPKVNYLVERVLEPLAKAQERLNTLAAARVLAPLHGALQGFTGVGSFMSGQIIADLKNTPGHPCYEAKDKYDFVAHGPGSLRGLSWVLYGNNYAVTPKDFYLEFPHLRRHFDLDAQNLQNCLCEFDKYMRIKNGTGKSKRTYPGRV